MRALAVAAALAAVTAARPASAQSLSHLYQLGLSTSAGTGGRAIFLYDGAPSCGDPGKSICTARVPTWLDVALFFGATRSIDLLLAQRIGLEKDYYGSLPLALMPGARFYPSPNDRWKVFFQAQLVLDFSDAGPKRSPIDVGVRETNGLAVDVNRWFGAWIVVAETATFVRSFALQLEAGAGVEARLP